MSKAANIANSAALFPGPICGALARKSVYRTGGGYSRIELDFPERALVIRDILVQDGGQGLGLLWAQIDSLKIAYLDLRLRLLLHGPEDQEKVPHIDSHLHAVGIGFPIIAGIGDVEIWLHGDIHDAECIGK